MIDPHLSLLGLCVGVLVGMTGVGGGSLMTPLLILMFGVPPVTAVSTDLVVAAVTKIGGSVIHGFAHSIDWRVVRRLASGSIPATVGTIAILSRFNLDSGAARGLITLVLSVVLFATAFVLVFGKQIVGAYRARIAELDRPHTAKHTVLVGILIGVLVSLSSIGAGAIGAITLILLYPRHPIAKIVGSDIAHAVPLTLVAGLGYWMIGSVNWHIVISLLVGSLPGIFIGSYFAIRIPERGVQLALGTTLFVVASWIAFDRLGGASPFMTVFGPRSTR